jgi:hypothetical protein
VDLNRTYKLLEYADEDNLLGRIQRPSSGGVTVIPGMEKCQYQKLSKVKI